VKGNTQEDDVWDRGYVEIRIGLIKKSETISLTGTVATGLAYKKEMVLTAQGNTKRPVSWFIEGNCIFVESTERWARVRANAGQGNCKVEARLYENEWFTGASATVDQGLVLLKEKVSIVAKSQIWNGRSITLRYSTTSGRAASFKTTSMCRILKSTNNTVTVASRFTFGACMVTGTVTQSAREGSATASTRIALLSFKQQRQAEMYDD
jgi:hypothetical protein